MPFTSEQFQAVYTALSAKVVRPCPSCNEAQKREIQQELFLVSGSTRPPLKQKTATGLLPPPPPRMRSGPGLVQAQWLVPCVMTVCTNCGLTELYNSSHIGNCWDSRRAASGGAAGLTWHKDRIRYCHQGSLIVRQEIQLRLSLFLG